MLSADDPSVVAVAEALAAILRQSTLRRLHEVVSVRGGLALERSAYPVLGRIAAIKRARLSDVAAALGVAVATVSRQVQQLERAGLVQRASDVYDGRVVIVELTPAGDHILERVRQVWREVLVDILASWPAQERASLAELLDRLATELTGLRGEGGE